jgi:hypothetical protein
MNDEYAQTADSRDESILVAFDTAYAIQLVSSEGSWRFLSNAFVAHIPS